MHTVLFKPSGVFVIDNTINFKWHGRRNYYANWSLEVVMLQTVYSVEYVTLKFFFRH
jgi:hypothetical protein